MGNSPKYGIPLLSEGQGSAEISANYFFGVLEALSNCVLNTVAQNSPPGSPVDGEVHLVGTSPTGDWIGEANKLAVYWNGWHFFAVPNGFRAFDDTAKEHLAYSSSEMLWHPMQTRWSTTEYWTGEYRTPIGNQGGTKKKQYAKVVEMGTLLPYPSSKTVAHNITGYDQDYPTEFLLMGAQTTSPPIATIPIQGAFLSTSELWGARMDFAAITIETTNPLATLLSADLLVRYCKTS